MRGLLIAAAFATAPGVAAAQLFPPKLAIEAGAVTEGFSEDGLRPSLGVDLNARLVAAAISLGVSYQFAGHRDAGHTVAARVKSLSFETRVALPRIGAFHPFLHGRLGAVEERTDGFWLVLPSRVTAEGTIIGGGGGVAWRIRGPLELVGATTFSYLELNQATMDGFPFNFSRPSGNHTLATRLSLSYTVF